MPEPLTQEEVLAKLEAGESFRGVEVGGIDFRNYQFEKEPDFSGAIFTGFIEFSGAHFQSGANFSEAEFSGSWVANFNSAKFACDRGANFTSAKFLNGANFPNAEFYGRDGAYFHSSKFSGQNRANFIDTKFLNGARFDMVHFSGEEETWFSGAKFSGTGRAQFFETQFSSKKGANFNSAKFDCNMGADFRRTKFSSRAQFINTKFSGDKGVDFMEAHFSGGAKFINTEFTGKTSFSRARFSGTERTTFEEIIFEENKPVWFIGVTVDQPNSLEFVDVSTLGSLLFLYTDLEKINFKNVYFRQTFFREILADENRNKLIANKNEKVNYNRNYYSQVEILYRKLKENFEAQLDFGRAGDFHYGEMEMKRKGKMIKMEDNILFQIFPFLKFFTLIQLYKIVSGYGEKWKRAFISFIFIWIIFSYYNPIWVEPKAEVSQEQPARMEQWKQDSIHRLGGSALFSLKVLTLQRWGDEFQLKGSSYFPRFFVAVQHLIGPTIIALMLLAIRRQFRR